MKKLLIIIALVVGVTSMLDLSAAHAAPTVAHYGNVATTATASGITMSAGGTDPAEMQVFSFTRSLTATALTFYAYRTDAGTTGLVKLTLCAYPNTQVAAACGNNAMQTWTIDVSTLSVGAFQSITLPVNNIFFYSSIGYGLLFERQSGAGNFMRLMFSQANVYPEGTLWSKDTRCPSKPWIQNGITNGLDCNGMGDQFSDLVFDFFASSAGQETINVRQNGPDVSFFGNCIQSSDLPVAWSLDSNLVTLTMQDITSATGTSVTTQTQCTTQGTYDSASTTRTLWNGNWAATATQSGTPTTFSATTTFTVSGSTARNPIDALNLCITPDLFDIILHPSSIKSAVSCSFNAMINTFADAPPFSWYTQIKTALTASSTPAVIDATIHMPGPHGPDLILYRSSSSTAGIAGEINKFPKIGGKSLRELMVIFLWCCFAVYVVTLPYRFVKT